MAHTKLFWISQCSVALGLLLGTGCGKDDDAGDEDANDSSGTGSESADDDDSNTVSDSVTTDSITTDSADGSSSVTADSGSDDVSTFEDSGTDDGDPPAPNGSTCSEDADCESMHCYTSALGNICGECVTDEHCADTTGGGCSIPNPLASPPTGAVCNDGSLGGGCMSSDVCMEPLVCVEILNAAPIIVASTCSECETDADCVDGDLCSPGYDVMNLSGSKTCVVPGSVINGEGCDFTTSGNDACFSGFCAVANVMDIVQLGVCSECLEDTDCGGNETCEPPVISLDEGLTAGFCM